MAEFGRYSGNSKRGYRTIEWIETRKSTKSETYEFYKRARKQLQRQGVKVDPLLKEKKVKKSDIIRELEKFETIHQAKRERELEEQYNTMVEFMDAVTPSEAEAAFNKFQKKLLFQESQGLISLKNIFGGGLSLPFGSNAPEPEPEPDGIDVGVEPVAPPRTKYTGRFAHDLIAKWCDDGLLDTEDFEDSDEIWDFMDDTTQQATEYDFFQANYEGVEKVGSKKYYDEFKEFLTDSRNFERDMRSKNQGDDIPEYGTQDYWKALAQWRDDQNSRPF